MPTTNLVAIDGHINEPLDCNQVHPMRSKGEEDSCLHHIRQVPHGTCQDSSLYYDDSTCSTPQECDNATTSTFALKDCWSVMKFMHLLYHHIELFVDCWGVSRDVV